MLTYVMQDWFRPGAIISTCSHMSFSRKLILALFNFGAWKSLSSKSPKHWSAEESGSEASVSGEDASDFEPENEVNGVEEDEESEANSTTDATSDDDEDTIGVGRHERSGSQSLHNSPALHNILALSTLQSTQRARRLSFTPERETSNASLHPMPLYNQAGQCFGYGYCVDLRETQGARDGPVRDEVWSHTGQRVAFIDRQRVQTDPEGDIAATQKTASLPSTPAQGIEVCHLHRYHAFCNMHVIQGSLKRPILHMHMVSAKIDKLFDFGSKSADASAVEIQDLSLRGLLNECSEFHFTNNSCLLLP